MNNENYENDDSSALLTCMISTRPHQCDPGAASERRPAPVVRRYLRSGRGAPHSRASMLAISQRDDTVLVAASQARRLAYALLRAAHG